MKLWTTAFISVVAMLIANVGVPDAHAGRKDICVISNGDNFVSEAFIQGVASSPASFDHVDLSKDRTIACDDYRLLVAVGSKAIHRTVDTCYGHQMLAIDSSTSIRSLDFKALDDHWFDFTYVDQHPAKVISAVGERFPTIKRIGVLVSNVQELGYYQHMLDGMGFQIVYEVVPQGVIPGISFMRLIEKVDAVLITPNAKIWVNSNIKAFLLAGIRQGKVLIGGINPQYVSAGVFAGSYTDFKKLGGVVGISVKNNVVFEVSGYFGNSEFLVNENIVTRLGIRSK